MPTLSAAHSPQLPDKASLSSKETAEAIGWQEGSLRRARCRADSGMSPPPHIKRGNQVIYPRDTLIQWMLERGYSPRTTAHER